uniref:Uncharacterized protein n=1 Tax=Salix viminalis TaxID=40686 RepID=A0A6N2MBV1_SALVM
MGLFEFIFNFFVSSSSSRVTDEARNKTAKPKSKSKPAGAPIVVSHFPVNYKFHGDEEAGPCGTFYANNHGPSSPFSRQKPAV